MSEIYSAGWSTAKKVGSLDSFNATFADTFELAAAIGTSEKSALLTQLVLDLRQHSHLDHQRNSAEKCEGGEEKEDVDDRQLCVLLLEALLTALRLCLRERGVVLEPPTLRALILDLMTCVASPPPSSSVSLLASRCLLNLLHLVDAAADLFVLPGPTPPPTVSDLTLSPLHPSPLSDRANRGSNSDGLGGLQWLAALVWSGGSPKVLLYTVRTLYMLFSKRDELVELSFDVAAFSDVLGSASLYHVLMSMVVTTCYRGDGGGGRCLAVHKVSRAALFQELSKLLYLLRSHSSFPATAATKDDDLELQVTAMHLLMSPHLIPPPPFEEARGLMTTNENSFACKVSALQLLMVAATTDPDPQRFHGALTSLAARLQQRDVALPSEDVARILMKRISYCPHPFSGEPVSVLVPVMLVPFLRSLLEVLELLLLKVAGSVKGGLSAMGVSGSSGGVTLIPILTILTSLAEHGGSDLRGLLLHLLLVPPPPSAEAEVYSGGSSGSDGCTEANATKLSPKCFVSPHSLHAKLLQLMTSLETYSKRYASELLFALCDKNADRFIELTGFGNAVSLLQTKGLFGM